VFLPLRELDAAFVEVDRLRRQGDEAFRQARERRSDENQ
jgi:hypothetical protein